MLAGLPDHSTKREKRMLHKVQKRDAVRAAKVLASAFQHDPGWNKICEGESDIGKRFRAIFEVAVRFGLTYGEVYAPSEDLEGIIAWVPGKCADMNTWHMIRSGALVAAMRIGLNVTKKMGAAYKPVTDYRREYMALHTFRYLLVFGVPTELQGKGFGRKLIEAVIEKSDRDKLQLYVGAGSEENVKTYEHFGFRVLKQFTLPIIDLPEWEMVRDPKV